MKPSAVITLAAVVVAGLITGCQSTASKPAPQPLTPAQVAQRERDIKIQNAQRRQALTETVRVLEIQVADADVEVGRLQSVMTQGGPFLEAYNEAYQKREELRTRLEDARTQLSALPD